MSFDPNPDVSGDGGSGGKSTAGSSTGSSGSKSSAGSSSQAGTGSDEGGQANGGSTSAGNSGADPGGSGNESGKGGTSSAGSGGNAGEGTAGNGGSMGGGGSGANAGSGGDGGNAGSGGVGGSVGGGGSGGSGGGGGEGGSGGAGGNVPCTSAFYGGHGYTFCGVVDSAAAAFAKCESLNLTMVSIESKAENTYVQSKQGSTWLGSTDEGSEGEWRWLSTKVLFWKEKPVPGVYQNFIDGQPSNKDKDGNPENCLVLSASGWNDVGCALGGFKVTCESSGAVVQPQL